MHVCNYVHMLLRRYTSNTYFIAGSGSHGPTHVVGRVVSNESDQDRTINVMGRTFFVPPKSSFLLSDVSNIKPLYDHACT